MPNPKGRPPRPNSARQRKLKEKAEAEAAAKTAEEERLRALSLLPPPPPPPPPREVYLAELAHVGALAPADRKAGITRAEVKAWERDPAFRQAEKDALADFVDNMEAELVSMARAGADHKANYMALISVLNAHSAKYGRVRWEMLERSIMSFLKALARAVNHHATPDVAKAIMTEVEELTRAMIVSPFFGGKQ